MSKAGGKKKSKVVKKLKRRADSWVKEDVQASTSIPPKVDGQLRCYLRLSVNQVLWMIPNSPELTHVRVQWWGEEGEGTIFRPVDVKKGKKGGISRTNARFPVRSGPKQLAAYFNDMGSLVLEVLSGPLMVTVGRAQVDHISRLAPNRPINGFFSVFSADTEKVAELQVAIVLESLMASYDSSSSIPTPDMSSNIYAIGGNDIQPNNPSMKVVPAHPPAAYLYSSTDDPFTSPAAIKQQSGRTTPCGIDSQIFGSHNQLRDSVQSRSSALSHMSGHTIVLSNHQGNATDNSQSTVSRERSTTTTHPVTSGGYGADTTPTLDGALGTASTLQGISTLESQLGMSKPGSPRRGSLPHLDASSDVYKRQTAGFPSSDLVSVLLQRGGQLREAMIASTLNTPEVRSTSITDMEGVDMGIYSPLRKPAPLRRSSTGSFLKEILTQQSPERDVESLEQGQVHSEQFDQETWALKMVLGDEFTAGDDMLMHAYHSQSGSDAGNDLSDFGDPLHDDDILEELFYKEVGDESDISVSDNDEMKTKTWGATDMSQMSMDEAANLRPASRSSLDMEPVRDCGHIRSSPMERHIHVQSSSGERKRNERSPPREKKRKNNNISVERKRNGSHSPGEKKRNRKGKAHHDIKTMNESQNITDLPEQMSISYTPSEAEQMSTVGKTGNDAPVEGLSVQRLTLLGRIDVARVVIDRLRLHDEMNSSRETTPTKGMVNRGRVKGKPPRPVRTKKASTYFVEYQFPVVTTSKVMSQPNIMATEVMRVASKKVVNGDVSYNHRSVFPVQFDQESIEKWWTIALVFKIYCRRPNQKVPQLIGMCSVPLKCVLKSEALFLEKIIDIKERTDPCVHMSDSPFIGNLKVSIELASYGKDFSTALAKTRLAEMIDAKVVPIPVPKPKKPLPPPQSFPNGQEQTATQTEPRPVNLDRVPHAPPPGPPAWTGVYSHPQPSQTPAYQLTGNFENASIKDYEESLTLHSLLLIPEGENISPCGTGQPLRREGKYPQHPVSFQLGRDAATRNLYLVCRMFWCDDVVNSNVCWGTSNPKFNFAQVEPILLTMSLLERLRNNFLVIEVWDKKTSAKSDELVGILKLPLHQFYMSYRDRRIAASLLKSQYPVVSVDSHMPIVSPFSGAQFGKLKVLLAMGSQTQIGNLQRMMQDKGSAIAIPERPSHCLERQHLYGEARTAEDYAASTDNMVEHVFEVGVESVKGLRLRDNMIWGEADCFIQYHFPTQMTSKHQGAPQIMHATPSLKTFRTATTLCIPDPVFNDLVRHKIVMPEGTPVQREILNACAGVGGGAGGIPLEVWCRYYYPNVRDQVIAKATLPLAKLCALVTMQKRGEANVQTFTLPLSSIVISDQEDDHEAAAKIEDSGLLEVTINYKSHILKGVSELHRPDAVNQGRPGATVCVSVGVIRASGLKMAASALARLDQGMQYPAEVGVNSYIRVRMSHLEKEDERVTRTVARTFAPEFNFYLDFPSPLLWTQPGSDALSLAEILQTAEVTFDLWHQIPGSDIEVDRHYVNTGSADVCGRKLVPVSGDVLLGSISLPLRGLLTHKTGINGWFPMNLPSVGWDIPADDGRHGNRGIERVIGGLELSLKFGHHDDLERVEQAARGVGWAPDFDIGHRDWDEADELLDQYHQVAVAVDLACFPLQNALVIGQTKLDAAARCYVRYKFYDRNAVCSKLRRPDLNEDDYLSVHVQHSKTLVIPGSSPFTWYLREERLEIQVWVTYTSENAEKQRPRNRDKLIGSAYIDLSSLADTRRRHHRVSDLYPLFKPGTSSLGGACIRAHVTLTPRATGYQLDDESDDEGDMYSQRKDDCKSKKSSPKKKLDADKTDNVLTVDLENTFMVHVSIERALHMPWVSEEGNDVPPSCYVSYQTSNESDSTHTDICMANDDPVWKHEHDARFHRDLLTQANKNLVFKVWHKPRGVRQEPDKGVDKVLGFVSVDLSLLLRGFHRLTGWYNIINFSGDCQGQIKVSVVPQESLQRFQGLITTPTPEPTDGSEFTTPLDPSMAPFPHFSEHYENVKRCHLRLHDTMLAMGGADPSTASRSTLRSNLRDNIQELDEMTNRLKERLQVQSSSPAPFSSSVVHPQSTSQDKTGTTSYAAPTSVPAVSTTLETLHLAVPLQPFASDSLENVHSVQPRPESQIPTTSINDGSGQFLEIANQGDTDLSTIEGATVEGACVYESALKNARQMLQNIDQHMRASPATGTLTVSATYELVSGDATPPCDASDETDTTAATMTRHAHFEEQGDDTLAPFWNRSYEYDDDDADDEDVTVVEARPLNDVSSANFCNGLPNAVLIREQTAFTEINSTSSRTHFSVDYSMDNEVEDEFDYRGRPYAPGGSTSDDFSGDWGSRLGACMHGLNYNVNSNVGATETATHENGSADGNSDDVDGNHSANGTDAEHDGSGEVGLKETSHKAAKPTRGTLKHQGTAHGIGSSSEEEEEEREVRNRHGTAHETVCDDRVHGETRNEKVNGMSSVHSSEHSRKSSDSSQDSRNRQNPALSNHSSEHSRKYSSSQDSRNCQNQVLSIHSSEHSQKSSSSSQNRENAKSPLDVVKDDVVDTNDDVFSVDEIDGEANHERDLQTGGNTPSDSLSPDRAYKKPPASPRKGGEYDTVPTTTRGATTTAVPNFFLPLPHMEQTMRALRTAMTNDTRDQSHDKTRPGDTDNHRDQSVPVIDNYASRFSSVATKTRAQPSAEQAQRIAKIFSQRFA